MTKLIIILPVALGLVLAAIFTPASPWFQGEPPPPSDVTQPIPPPPAEPSPPENTLIFSEEELQNRVNDLVRQANQSSQVAIDYLQVKLDEDRMLVSAKGDILGHHLETENLEVYFEARTVSASGKISALGGHPTLIANVEINTEQGKPQVTVKRFRLGGLPLKLLGISRDDIATTINQAIESRGLMLPVDLEDIRIEARQLIVQYKEYK
ncbi:MAG: hypothetical protein J7K77_00730 [Dehalococcoidales bacterium]|nr:hypothetical protein [Dehalococcoidales bacterium]